LKANQPRTLRPTPIRTLQQEILLAAHDPVTGNPASFKSLTAEPSTDTSSDTTSLPSTPQTPNMSGITAAPAVHVSVTHIPARGHSTVPHFDGNALISICILMK
jgi:hypothetical protein